jgi:hypothetical protein
LTLTNGEVIWDISGNLYEWTTGQTTGGQPGNIGEGSNYRQWNAVTTHGTLSPDPFPSTTGISGSGSWTSSQGIGLIFSNADDTVLRGLYRGACYQNGGAGILTLNIYKEPNFTAEFTGFRVAR